MIMSFGNSATQRFATEGKSKSSGLDEDLADQRLTELNAATKLADLSALKSVNLHKLSGPLKEFWSVNVNGPWRLIFRFDAGNAYDVQIADTH